jgi:hypothetical protein
VRLVVTIAGLVTVLMLAIPGGGQASQAGRPNVTFIGDSVAASLLVVPEASGGSRKGSICVST